MSLSTQNPISRLWRIFLLVFLCFNIQAKAGTIDSLKIALDLSENPHEKLLIQIDIGKNYYRTKSYDTAIFEFRKAVSMVPDDSLALKAKTLNYLGNAHRKIEDMDNYISIFKLSNDLYVKSDAPAEDVATSFKDLGRAYYSVAKYDSAMTFYMEAKKIYEQNDIVSEDYGGLLHYIGSVYKRQGNYDMACQYYDEEVEYGREHGFKGAEVEGLYLSAICIEEDSLAVIRYRECLRIYADVNSIAGVALMYQLIGGSYFNMGQLDSALHYHLECLELRREIGEASHLASALQTVAHTYVGLAQYNKAQSYIQEALDLTIEKVGNKRLIRLMDIYDTYFFVSYGQGKYKEAIDHLSLMHAYKDSAQDQDHQHTILEIEKTYDQEKQQAEFDKQLALEQEAATRAKESEEHQASITRMFMIGGILVIALSIFVFIKYRESNKQKKIISKQQQETEHQKNIIEAKNRDITDSMVYASSIQRAIITSDEYIQKMFSDFFSFYRPRDIVSGDFYWAYETTSGEKMIAIGDCTGHGVPGAMMSMLGCTLLNEIVVEKKQTGPANILNQLKSQVIKALSDDDRKDGMDMGFCQINKNTLTYAGANLPLYIFRDGQLTELKGDKQAVGKNSIENDFTQTTFELQENDVLYLFSDGYVDQFGGEKGKKYKRQTFRDKLAHVSTLSFAQQRKVIEEEFENWKGDIEQLDDVCVLGVRI